MIYFGVAFFVVVILVVGVSAKHAAWHFWGPDVQEAPFDATVTVQNAAPVIEIPIIGVKDEEDAVTVSPFPEFDSSISPELLSVGDGIDSSVVRFVVTDPNGKADLPGGTVAIVTASGPGEFGVTANLEIIITSPGTEHTAVPVYATSCVDVDCTSLPTECPTPSNQRMYDCTVPLQYYYEPDAAYSISISVNDGPVASADTDVDTSQVMTYESLLGYDVTSPVGGLVWTDISLTSGDQLVDTDMGLTNRGNTDIIAGTIQGSTLTKDGAGVGDDLPIDTFAISAQSGVVGSTVEQCCVTDNPDAACTGGAVAADELSTGVVTIGTAPAGTAVDLVFGDVANTGAAPPLDLETLYYCLWEQLDLYTPTLTLDDDVGYSSTQVKGTTPGTAGHAWELILSDL